MHCCLSFHAEIVIILGDYMHYLYSLSGYFKTRNQGLVRTTTSLIDDGERRFQNATLYVVLWQR